MIGQCLYLCPVLLVFPSRGIAIPVLVEDMLEEASKKICSENCIFIILLT